MTYDTRKSKYRSDYEILEITDDIIFLVDLDLGNKSITNDAEEVVRELHEHFPGKRIVYKDTIGNWDEIIVLNSLCGFMPYRDKIPSKTILNYPHSIFFR